MKAIWVLALSLTVASGAASPLLARTHYTPIQYRETSGIRPFVPVRLNGKKLVFMIHANAGFNAMTTHANAEAAGVHNLVSKGQFGITGTGVKSRLGRATAVADTFSVGESTIRRFPIDVFEIPQTPPVDGMLGIGWLRQSKAIIDYRLKRLGIPGTHRDAATERARLLKQGYTAVPMTWDAKNYRYYVGATVNGRPARFNVSTVSHVIIDEPFAHSSQIALSAPVDTFGGPTGTTGAERETASAYTLEIGGLRWKAPKARVYDIFAYDGEARPADMSREAQGYLGCDFMLANHAVIDFGSRTLFLKRGV